MSHWEQLSDHVWLIRFDQTAVEGPLPPITIDAWCDNGLENICSALVYDAAFPREDEDEEEGDTP